MIMNKSIGLSHLINQGIYSGFSSSAAEVVARMGFIQAQDYLGALWAVGLRMQAAVESDIEQALADKHIVRTWPARGTLHFVSAKDVRWVLELLSPQVIKARAWRMRELELDKDILKRSRNVFIQALQDGQILTREEMYQRLESEKISTAKQRGIYLLWNHALEGLICFGPRRGKQQTFVLLDDWLPPTPAKSHDEALGELARRYFSSHGPASLADFTWWSGLNTSEAKKAVELVLHELEKKQLSGITLWSLPEEKTINKNPPSIHLLPAFDEFLVAYKNRDAVLDPEHVKRINAGGGLLNPVIVVDGLVQGTWKRTLKKGHVVVQPSWFNSPDASWQTAYNAALQHYAAFLQLDLDKTCQEMPLDIQF